MTNDEKEKAVLFKVLLKMISRRLAENEDIADCQNVPLQCPKQRQLVFLVLRVANINEHADKLREYLNKRGGTIRRS